MGSSPTSGGDPAGVRVQPGQLAWAGSPAYTAPFPAGAASAGIQVIPEERSRQDLAGGGLWTLETLPGG